MFDYQVQWDIIHFWNGCSEYIIDLMGAPGALIPAEAPSGRLENLGLDARTITTVGIGSFPAAGQGARAESSSNHVYGTAKSSNSGLSQIVTASNRNGGRLAGKIQSDLLEQVTEDPYLPSSGACKKPLLAGKERTSVELQVENVPRYTLLLLVNQTFLENFILCSSYGCNDGKRLQRNIILSRGRG